MMQPTRANLQNIQKTIQIYTKKKQTMQLKNKHKTYVDISPKKTYNGQQAHEKMLNITNY